MQQSFVAFLALSLASTVAAMPGRSLHVRQMRSLAQSLAPRDNIDWEHGTCGGTTGYVCASGSCCSQYGYCGSDGGYCAESGSSGSTGSDSSVSTGSASSGSTGSASSGSTGSASSGSTGSASSGSTGSNSSGSSGGAIACSSRKLYSGDGSTGAGWPSQGAWASFDNLWNANAATIAISCTQFGQANNSPTETAELKSAITSVAASSGIDARFILATVMQESKGCVRVRTTFGSVSNPGLLQDHNGAYTCYGINPCPKDKIVGMIKDGTTGTSSGDGLQQIMKKLSTSGAQKVYQAARVYNSGSLPSDGNLSSGGATSSYPSDIANRLTGCVF